MLPRLATPLQQNSLLTHNSTHADASMTCIGVGLDTFRHGRYAAFLNTDLQAAAPELELIGESQRGQV